jgi:hypothetical protein
MGFVMREPHDFDVNCEYLKTDQGCYYCCEACNYDRHICHFCGDNLTHLNNLSDGSPNPCYEDDNE